MTFLTSPALESLIERERLPATIAGTIASVHEPLAAHIAASMTDIRKPLVIGVCGPQGSGKSTLTAIVSTLLQARGVSVAVLSLDDLYLTRSERERLANRIHPLLQTRGVPGTHDVALGVSALDALGRPGGAILPSFDKAADDRCPPSASSEIATPVDVVLFEGWCVGARPQNASALATPVNDLERDADPHGTWRRFVNDALRDEYQKLFARIDMLILLKTSSFDMVYRWRAEQERKLRERIEREGGDTSKLMDEPVLRRFIAHYERLTRHIMDEMPGRADIVVELDAERIPQRIRGLTRPSRHP